ncbi:Gfo/Idh/MocA family oxidoreductase [Saccharopolyspora taberi]|uniref:Gfo/Idh/MocA-like oxidoreductase N-terminal domain-containing protein n=1 Tax=Saccharopolyspora taberi TaxID=60895 RepID=A0ABN3VGX3_9PSEU
MRIVIAGIGTIGSRHVACFGQAGHEVITVDRRAGADADRVDRVPDPSNVDAWVVATPTASHLAVVDEILRSRPDAHILLEKPACYPADLADLLRTIRSHPRSRVVVNDVYAYSGAVQRFAEVVRGSGDFDQIMKITMEFTKNRELDVANGRFVDTQYGEAGYEFFHMLSILRSIVPADRYETYLRTVPVLVTPELRVRTLAANLPEIELYASSTGAVGFGHLAGFAFSASESRHYLARSRIPYGADLRYRFADVEFRIGRHVTLVFEPWHGTAVDHRNKHAVHLRDTESQRHFTFSGNHFNDAILRQLDLLHNAAEGTSVLRLAEHQYMAGLGLAAAAGGFLWPLETDLYEKLA